MLFPIFPLLFWISKKNMKFCVFVNLSYSTYFFSTKQQNCATLLKRDFDAPHVTRASLLLQIRVLQYALAKIVNKFLKTLSWSYQAPYRVMRGIDPFKLICSLLLNTTAVVWERYLKLLHFPESRLSCCLSKNQTYVSKHQIVRSLRVTIMSRILYIFASFVSQTFVQKAQDRDLLSLDQ